MAHSGNVINALTCINTTSFIKCKGTKETFSMRKPTFSRSKSYKRNSANNRFLSFLMIGTSQTEHLSQGKTRIRQQFFFKYELSQIHS